MSENITITKLNECQDHRHDIIREDKKAFYFCCPNCFLHSRVLKSLLRIDN